MSHQDLQAERALLGCVLAGASPRDVDVAPDEFSSRENGWVWDAMLTLAAQGSAIDHLTVSEVLKVRGQLSGVGGPAALMGMDVAGLVTGIQKPASIVKDRAARRRLHAEFTRAANMTVDLNLAPERIAGEAVQRLLGSNSRSGEDSPDADIHDLIDAWGQWEERQASGVPQVDGGAYLKTGIDIIDKLFVGWPCNLGVIGGKASMGKTALVAEMIWNWLTRGINVGIVGLEDGTKWLTRRHLARVLGIPVAQVGACRLDQNREELRGEWFGYTSGLYRKHLRIHRSGGIDAPGLVAKLERWLGDGLRVAVVDHGLRVNYDTAGGRRTDLAIGRTVDSIATLADRHKASVIFNWHLNRDNEEESPPRMRDFKESGYLDAAARAMLGLWEQSSRPGYLLVTGVKATEGKRDWTVAVERDPECALVKSTGGYEVDFRGEQAARQTEKAAAKAQLFKPVPLVRRNSSQ